MWKQARVLGFGAILCLAGCGLDEGSDPLNGNHGDDEEMAPTLPHGGHETARAFIEGRSGANLSGEATFAQRDDGVLLAVSLSNASPGQHAVHIHEVGDCSAPDAESAGAHWNPRGERHGKRGSESFHAGDIGNVDVGPDGTGALTLTAKDWSIAGAGDDPMGKAVVVHAGADDFETQPDGGGGQRIGCGVIERDMPATAPNTSP
jgi:Cu-Zn family superoxide dismutase